MTKINLFVYKKKKTVCGVIYDFDLVLPLVQSWKRLFSFVAYRAGKSCSVL